MRGLVLLCLVGTVVVEGGNYTWSGPGQPAETDPNTDNLCLTDSASCGCCLMQRQMTRMEQFFNMSLNELQRGLEKAQTALNNVRASRSAFSVALTDTRRCVGPEREETTVIYSVVFLNLGNSYNVNTGVFTVPRSGVYILALSVYSDAGSPGATLAACVSLRVNGREIAAPSERNQQDQEDNTATVLAVQLQARDTVSVRLLVGCFLCDDSSHYNTFTGFLLYATD